MVSFSIPTFMTGIELFTGMAVYDALWSLLIGATLLTLMGGFMGWIGVKTRKSAYLLVNVAFGRGGSNALNLLFALSLVGWFGLNLDLFAASVNEVLIATIGKSVHD
jgi:cytosine permease